MGDHRGDRWIWVFDQYSRGSAKDRNALERVTVQIGFLSLLKQHEVPFLLELHGGKNLFVGYESFRAFCKTHAGSIRSFIPSQNLNQALASRAIVSESDLEEMLIYKLKQKTSVFPELFGGEEVLTLRSQERYLSVDGGRKIPDIIVETSTLFVIIELKRGLADSQAFQQLAEYMDCPAIVESARAKMVVCVLIARAFSDSLHVRRESIVLYEYDGHNHATLRLKKRCLSETGYLGP